MLDKDTLFMQILDLVATYCDSVDDFNYIIDNIETMKENLEEEEEEDK